MFNFDKSCILPVALYPHLFPGPKRLRIAFRPSSLVPHQTLFHSLECLALKIRFSPNIFEIVELTWTHFHVNHSLHNREFYRLDALSWFQFLKIQLRSLPSHFHPSSLALNSPAWNFVKMVCSRTCVWAINLMQDHKLGQNFMTEIFNSVQL